jgi:hypothetical protein
MNEATYSTQPDREYFVWTRMSGEAGQALPFIIRRKEEERLHGNGLFWWGVGNSVDRGALQHYADKRTNSLPVRFSPKKGDDREEDLNPLEVLIWSHADGQPIPPHVLLTSGPPKKGKSRFALVCHSSDPIMVVRRKPFNHNIYTTYRGERIPDSGTTVLICGPEGAEHRRYQSEYELWFSAALVNGGIVQLENPTPMSAEERKLMLSWKPSIDWMDFVRCLRRS